jgi:DNA-binding transcriptional regulator YhcF (GntR family)
MIEAWAAGMASAKVANAVIAMVVGCFMGVVLEKFDYRSDLSRQSDRETIKTRDSSRSAVSRDFLVCISYGFHHVVGMPPLKTSSVSDQVASHLRAGIVPGRWKGLMPGRDRLAAELGVSPWTVQRGLDSLENESLLVPQGGRRQRRIVISKEKLKPHPFRIQILLFDKDQSMQDYLVGLKYRPNEMGHICEFATKSLIGLGMDVRRIARFVATTPADGWVVMAASSAILEWFGSQPVPTFALFGLLTAVSLAGTGPGKSKAVVDAVRRLVKLGHRRIVMIVREERRRPEPGYAEQSFLDELAAQGIATSSYNLPESGGDTPAELRRVLDSLFKHSPPTALFIDTAPLFIAVQNHLARRGHFGAGACFADCPRSRPWFFLV